MFGEIVLGMPKHVRNRLLHDPQMTPIDLVTDDAHIDSVSGALICKQRVHLADWASPGTIALRVYPDNSPLYGYPEIGHEPGRFFTLDEKHKPHEYIVGQIFPFNPPDMPVDQRPADILDWKSTGRLKLEIEWDHDSYRYEDGENWLKNPNMEQLVDDRIGELPIAIKIGRVILMAIPDEEVLIMQQGYPESTSYKRFILFGKTDYFTTTPDAPEPAGYTGAEVIVPIDFGLLKSAQLLFLNSHLAPILSERTNMGLHSTELMQRIVTASYGQLAQIPTNNV